MVKKWVWSVNWVYLNNELIESIDFFACWWCKFREFKIGFNCFWVSVVKNWRGHLVHETVICSVSEERIYEFS